MKMRLTLPASSSPPSSSNSWKLPITRVWLFFLLLSLSSNQNNGSRGIVGVYGYAAWLKCFVELDPSEVIMNQYIVPYEKSDVPGIQLEVKHYVHDDELGQPGGWVAGQFSYTPTAAKPTKIAIRLQLPDPVKNQILEARRDVQWVLETTTGAKFVYSDACDGTRAYASRDDEKIILQIGGTEYEEQDTPLPESIELVAAWATGHEAVTLTPKLILKKVSATEENDTTVEL